MTDRMPPTPSPEPVRPAVAADVPAIEAIVRAAYSPYVARIGREPGPMLDDYAALVAAGRVHVIGPVGAPGGLVVLVPSDAALLLDNIAVAPERHGGGIGRRLMAFTEAFATARGLATVALYTNARMVENLALYRRWGFVETHRVVEKGFDRVYMAKRVG